MNRYTENMIKKLAADGGMVCRYCRIDVRLRVSAIQHLPTDATVDHIVPRCEGGTNALENLALACRRCNQAKGDRSLAAFLADPRSAAERKARVHRRPVITAVPVPAEARKYDKPIRGTLAHAIITGEVKENGTYVRPKPVTVPPDAPLAKRMMSAYETAKWLRESAERKGKPWPLA